MTAVSADAILAHLRVLVAADSSDPVTQISPAHGAVAHCARTLADAGFAVSVDDLGGGCVNLLAVRGDADVRTGTLFNCHLDTVKANPNWTRDPFALSVEGEGDDRTAYGLGACDIKGRPPACSRRRRRPTDRIRRPWRSCSPPTRRGGGAPA
jgi:acetylornithine deacetylase/succinyl-diaminopimelate desuccinylase-like protein